MVGLFLKKKEIAPECICAESGAYYSSSSNYWYSTNYFHTFAYPYGTYNKKVLNFLKNHGYVAARGVQQCVSDRDYSYKFGFTNGKFDVKKLYDTKVFAITSETTLEEYEAAVKKVIKNGGMLTFLYHSVKNDSINDNNYQPISEQTFKKQLDILERYKDEIWIARYCDAIEYYIEANCIGFFGERIDFGEHIDEDEDEDDGSFDALYGYPNFGSGVSILFKHLDGTSEVSNYQLSNYGHLW